ncbi:hypothetical protein HPB47_005659 [Ixodes persulcatus]|uniref:Uncharacterized protein n=1 Tax=Ixodes persulcatus TaxID=34615 RepID=A0AC60PCC8_IXOPE|nr:hypothetical protein HPB47_005659 [Ixodes persulcatus]
MEDKQYGSAAETDPVCEDDEASPKDRIRCAAHTLQLAVNGTPRKDQTSKELLDVLNRVVNLFGKSPLWTGHLKEICKKGLGPSNWNPLEFCLSCTEAPHPERLSPPLHTAAAETDDNRQRAREIFTGRRQREECEDTPTNPPLELPQRPPRQRRQTGWRGPSDLGDNSSFSPNAKARELNTTQRGQGQHERGFSERGGKPAHRRWETEWERRVQREEPESLGDREAVLHHGSRETGRLAEERREGQHGKEETRRYRVEKRVGTSLYKLCSTIEGRAIAHLFGQGRSMVNELHKEFCAVVVSALEFEWVKMVSIAELAEHVRKFEATLDFPVPERCPDAHVFWKSALAGNLEEEAFQKPIFTVNGTAVVHSLILCDQAHIHARTSQTTLRRQSLNKRFSTTHRTAESAFGKVKRMECDVNKARLIVQACCVLSNVCKHLNNIVQAQWLGDAQCVDDICIQPVCHTNVEAGSRQNARNANAAYLDRRYRLQRRRDWSDGSSGSDFEPFSVSESDDSSTSHEQLETSSVRSPKSDTQLHRLL